MTTENEMPHSSIKRCVDYVRVSTDDQARKEYSSCKVQHDQCLRLIAARAADGWCSAFSVEDPGFSGTTTKRPGYQQLLQLVRMRQIDIIVVYNTDRVSRDVADYLEFLEFLKKHDVLLVSVTQSLEMKGAVGKFSNLMQAGIQQLERDRTAERTSDAMMEHALNGRWNGGNPPLGYTNERKRLEVVEAEAEVVRSIFRFVGQGDSLQEVADKLNRAGHRTKARQRLLRGAQETVASGRRAFRSDHLAAIVRNPIYRGVIRWNGTEYTGLHKALVDDKTWEGANRIIALPAGTVSKTRTQDRHFHLLKGLLFCAQCEVSLIPHWSGKKSRTGEPFRYYECLRHARREPSNYKCAGSLPVSQLDTVVLSALHQLGARPELLKTTLEASKKGGRAEGRERRVELLKADQELKEVNAEIAALIGTIKSCKMPNLSAEFEQEANELGKKKSDLLRVREQLALQLAQWKRTNPDPSQITRSLENLSGLIRRLPPPKRKELVQLLVDRIEIQRCDRESGAGGDSRRFAMRLRCTLPSEPPTERSFKEGANLTSGTPWEVRVEFELSRVGKGYRASFIEPFRQDVAALTGSEETPPCKIEHPIVQSLRWQKWINEDSARNAAAVAREYGVTPATVSLGMALLKLEPTIQNFLCGITDGGAVYFFSRRSLLPLTHLSAREQLTAFRAMQTKWKHGRLRAS